MIDDARVPAVVLAPGAYRLSDAKVAHGLVRDGDRFRVTAVLDVDCAGADAGVLLDGRFRNIPVVDGIEAALATGARTAVIGVATHGGRITPELRALLRHAIESGLDIVNGLHDCVADDPELASLAARRGVGLTDLRRPPPLSQLHFWHGEALRLRPPRIAVLGTDCAIGKRTTTRAVLRGLRAEGIRAEMIYTGQTGWMQGARHGFILDATPNDFVCGELEHALVTCARETEPDVMLIEGQSALRNPSGPCGAELLLAGGARGVILQHAPGRALYEGHEETGAVIPPAEDEIRLIAMYGARVLALTLHDGGLVAAGLEAHRRDLAGRLGIPVLHPLRDDIAPLLAAVRRHIEEETP